MPATAILLLLLGGGLLSDSAAAATYRVTPEGTGDFAVIQEALDAADSLDVIELSDGVFTGPGNRNLDFGGRTVVLRSRSDNPRACTIDCQGDSAAPGEERRGFIFRSGEGPGTVVRGVTITNGISGGD